MNRDRKLVKKAMESGLVTAPRDVFEALGRMLAVARHSPKHLAPGKSREERRAQRNDRMAEIRRVVMERAGNRCELCGCPASEAHHLLSGGLRRFRESVDTVLCLCESCHRLLHRNHPLVLEQALTYCMSAGMHDASAALVKRIDKLAEARASQGGTR